MTTTALIFDCDGVLVDSEAICMAEERRMLAEIGLSYRHDDYCRRFMGLSGPAFHAALDRDRLDRIGEGLPQDFVANLMSAIEAAWQRELRAVDGSDAFVAGLSAKKAVASSTSRKYLTWKLKHTGLFDHFAPHLYSAEQVGRGKPAPDLFLHTAAALAVPEADCIVIEDSANGIRAAKAAGMPVIGFLGGGHSWPGHGALLRETGAAQIASDFQELSVILHRDYGITQVFEMS